MFHFFNGHTCGEASCRGHSQFHVRVLIHGNDGRLPVLGRPLHHCIIFPTAEVQAHADVVLVGAVSSIGVYTDAERVALWVEEAFAFNWGAGGSGCEEVVEVVDLPHSTGTSSLSKSDVIN